MPLDTGFIGPVQDGIAGELTTVIAHNHPGFAALGHEMVQLSSNTRPIATYRQ
ncbi:hypothetical protein [Pseudochelatococcus sp. G4_1912]|uniref:hypothetical protein n=1 Tax=Pseudochelatococcus sp. G4_1912 TaxID=3114288 RepID=UPI0039C66495